MKTEQNRAGEFLLSESEKDRSRSQVTLTGGTYKAGAVLGVVTSTGKYTELKPSSSDGSQNAAGFLYADVDASSEDKQAVVIDCDAQVIDELVVWPVGITETQKKSAIAKLKESGIKVRIGSI